VFALLCALVFLAPHAAAQDGALSEPLIPAPSALDAATNGRYVPSGPPCQEHLIAVQLMLGLENIARIQAEVYHGERWIVMAEGQVGAEFFFVPSVGGGVRFARRMFDDGQSNAFFIAPGVDLLYAPAIHGDIHHSAWTVPEVSVDFSWVHDEAAHFGTELGVQLGLLVTPSTAIGTPVLPELSVYLGLRF
jgi:hypothetical protein